MLGVIVDTVLTLIGSLIGFFFNKHISKKWGDSVFKGLALCVLFVGIIGIFDVHSAFSVVLSVLVGSIIGSWLNIDEKIERLSDKLTKKIKIKAGNTSISQGFVDGCIICCVGAMTAVGCLKAGTEGDNSILILKAMLDFVSVLVIAASMGLGVVFTAIFVFIFESALVLLAQFLAPIFTENVIADMGCVGSLLIIAIGFNLMGITKIKVSNYLLCILLPLGITPLIDWIGKMIGA